MICLGAPGCSENNETKNNTKNKISADITAKDHGFVLAEAQASPCLKEKFREADHKGQLTKAWKSLQSFYELSEPERMEVKSTEDSFSGFWVDPAQLLIADNHCQAHLVDTIVHEASHVLLAHLTDGVSATTPFRFFDEGFAMIHQHMYANSIEDYRQTAFNVAGTELEGGNAVNFEAVQDWDTYFNTAMAYEVGATFDFFPSRASLRLCR